MTVVQAKISNGVSKRAQMYCLQRSSSTVDVGDRNRYVTDNNTCSHLINKYIKCNAVQRDAMWYNRVQCGAMWWNVWPHLDQCDVETEQLATKQKWIRFCNCKVAFCSPCVNIIILFLLDTSRCPVRTWTISLLLGASWPTRASSCWALTADSSAAIASTLCVQ